MIEWHFKKFDELTLDELYGIIRLRLEVFVVEQNAPYQDCDNKDQLSLHIYGTQDDKVVAYARCIPAGISYVEPCIGRVVTAQHLRRQGLGKSLVMLGLESMKTQFETPSCRISAQLYLKEFYSSFGFRSVSDVYLEDGLPHIEMVK